MPGQSHLFVAAELPANQISPVKALLATMTLAPGQADPGNALVPFGRLPELHVARFIVLEDPSLPDRVGPTPLPPLEPTRLAFIADIDGTPEDAIARLTAEAANGLAKIFRHCEPALQASDMAAWMSNHRIVSAATYTNWPGRSATQVREEALLHDALLAVRLAHPQMEAEALWPILRKAGEAITLTPLAKLGLRARLAEIADFLALPLLGIPLAPLLILLAPAFAIMLRIREKSDPVIAPRPSRERNHFLSQIEDHDVANQYGAIGTLKPGRFRLILTIVILWIINWGARHLYRRGRLGRVNTIHFASWTFLDDKRRVFFASNYDGSREAYNDDFINKVAFGLNVSFSNGLGYPRTDWLIIGGARHEQDFKSYLFHHQIPAQVWYYAHRGLTSYDMARNARLRAAFEAIPTGANLRRFVAEI